MHRRRIDLHDDTGEGRGAIMLKAGEAARTGQTLDLEATFATEA